MQLISYPEVFARDLSLNFWFRTYWMILQCLAPTRVSSEFGRSAPRNSWGLHCLMRFRIVLKRILILWRKPIIIICDINQILQEARLFGIWSRQCTETDKGNCKEWFLYVNFDQQELMLSGHDDGQLMVWKMTAAKEQVFAIIWNDEDPPIQKTFTLS